MTKDQLVDELRKQGYGRIADLLAAEVDAPMPVTVKSLSEVDVDALIKNNRPGSARTKAK